MSYFSAIGKFCLYVNAAMICDLLTVMTMTTICASSLMPDAVVAPITLSPRLHHKASKSSFLQWLEPTFHFSEQLQGFCVVLHCHKIQRSRNQWNGVDYLGEASTYSNKSKCFRAEIIIKLCGQFCPNVRRHIEARRSFRGNSNLVNQSLGSSLGQARSLDFLIFKFWTRADTPT